MTTTQHSDKPERVNVKVVLTQDTSQIAWCENHGGWASTETECPECFRIKQLPWWKRIFA